LSRYTPVCTSTQDTGLVHSTLTAKMHIHLRKHASAKVHIRYAHHDPSCNSSSAQEKARIHASPFCSRSCTATQESFNHPPYCRPHPICLLAIMNQIRFQPFSRGSQCKAKVNLVLRILYMFIRIISITWRAQNVVGPAVLGQSCSLGQTRTKCL